MTDDIFDPRRAGQVTRYHTVPRIREQSVGEHSWQLMRIVLALWPDAPRHLLVHCMTHDVGESMVGDPPYPIKRLNADLKMACDRIETETHTMMTDTWMLPPPADLTVLERSVAKLAEFIEMWEWSLYEMQMGNRHALIVKNRCIEGMQQMVIEMRARANGDELTNRILAHCHEYVGKRKREPNDRHETHGSSCNRSQD